MPMAARPASYPAYSSDSSASSATTRRVLRSPLDRRASVAQEGTGRRAMTRFVAVAMLVCVMTSRSPGAAGCSIRSATGVPAGAPLNDPLPLQGVHHGHLGEAETAQDRRRGRVLRLHGQA